DGGFGEGIEQLRAVLNDAAELLLRAGQKTGHVLEGDQGNIERIAEAYKARALHRSVDVEHTREHGRLVGDDAHRAAVESRETHDQVLGEVLVQLEEVVVVGDGVDDIFDVVGLHGIGGDERVEAPIGAVPGVGGGTPRRVFQVVRGHEAQ